MKVLLTSCGRHDLLKETIKSLRFWRRDIFFTDFIIHEDLKNAQPSKYLDDINLHYGYQIKYTGGLGQHASIEKFLKESQEDKYYLHLEDDWKTLHNDYDWMQQAIDLMEADPMIIKVLAREDMVHPVEYNYCMNEGIIYHKNNAIRFGTHNFGYVEPWQDPWKNITWRGFSWNPGVTRLDLLKKFLPFGKYEEDVSENIYQAGYKIAALEKGVYKHIGYGRSTQ